MKPLTIIGVILILAGIAGFIFGGISFTKKSKVADLGPLEIQSEKTESVPITPYASGAAVIAGIIMVIAGSRQKAL